MAIAFTNLGSSANPDIDTGADANSFSNSSWTPPTTGIICCFVEAKDSSGVARTPTMSGNSLTWVQIGSTLDTTSGGNAISLFIADATGATTGATTVDFGGYTQVHCAASFFQATGCDISGGVASVAVQQVTNTDTATSISVTLASAGHADNRPICMVWHGENESVTHRTNWTEIDEFTGAGQTRGINTQYRDDAFETTASGSWATSGNCAIMAVELRAAEVLVTISVSQATVESVPGSVSIITDKVVVVTQAAIKVVSGQTTVITDPVIVVNQAVVKIRPRKVVLVVPQITGTFGLLTATAETETRIGLEWNWTD